MEATAIAPQFGFLLSCLKYQTEHRTQFIDITDDVLERVDASGFRNGLLVVSTRHTTASLIVNEHEPELLKDLQRLLSEVAPPGGDYAHNAVPCGPFEQPNGHAHCQALLLSSSATVPVVDGVVGFGRYQRLFLVELDHARLREVAVTLLGA